MMTRTNSTPITNAYAKKITLNYIPPKAYKSQEYYFGESNPLKDGLVGWIDNLRSQIKDYKKDHSEATPFEMLDICKESSKKLKQIIIDNFNVEKVFVAWENEINAACFGLLGNRDVYGTGKEAEMIRKNVDDIIDVKKGFKYKNSKGIIYLIRLGFPIFAQDNMFTTEEAAACLVHELGHAMQHMINDVYQMMCLEWYQVYYEILGRYADEMSADEYNQCLKMMDEFERNKNNPEAMKKIGESLFKESAPNSTISYKNMDDDKLFGFTGVGSNNWDVDSVEDMKTAAAAKQAKHKGFFAGLGRFFKAIFTVPLAPFYYIGSKLLYAKDKHDTAGQKFKYFEETADNFCHIYGLGVASASLEKKFDQIRASFKVHTVLENVPILNFYYSYKSLKEDRLDTLAGYPTHKQRMMNMYRACIYELKNNKDLSEEDKKSLEKEIEEYKKFYDYFVYADSRKGRLYRALAGISRKGIEAAAKQDSNVTKNVLDPLNERMKKNKDFSNTSTK